jgi:nifR3 family TIM-barrel protein
MDCLPLFLSPMAELTHRALRTLVAEFGGCDEYYTEMISSAGLLSGGEFEEYYLDSQPLPEQTVFQLAGNDAEQLAKAAALVSKRNSNIKGIDINLGCSAPAILRQGLGAAWLRDADAAIRMIAAVRKATQLRLSVKLRTGYTEEFAPLLALCKRMQDEGVELITLHPRTVKQKFKRAARWDYVAALQAELTIPVAGNGDLGSMAAIVAKNNTTCCSALMLGRAAVKEPWIFSAVKKYYAQNSSGNAAQSDTKSTVINLETTAHRYLELLRLYQPEQFHLSRAKRFFLYYCKNFKWALYLYNKINNCDTLHKIEQTLQDFFVEFPNERVLAEQTIG